MDFPVLDLSYKWSPTVGGPLCLAAFTFVYWFHDSSMSKQVSVCSSFSWLNNIPLFGETSILFIHLSLDLPSCFQMWNLGALLDLLLGQLTSCCLDFLICKMGTIKDFDRRQGQYHRLWTVHANSKEVPLLADTCLIPWEGEQMEAFLSEARLAGVSWAGFQPFPLKCMVLWFQFYSIH